VEVGGRARKHLHWSAFEADVSALDYTGMKLVLPVGFAPTLDRV
jgi:hypothetical protein